MEPGINKLTKRGFKIKYGKYIREVHHYTSAIAEHRAKDLNAMFADKSVSAIFCVTGGCTANQILPLLDYDLIRENPKPIIGYSDITNLLLGIYTKTGITTYHGPGLTRLGKIDQPSEQFLFDLLMQTKSEYIYPTKMKVIKPGKASGKLLGGNLFVSHGLFGTPYSPDYKGAIWFWEELENAPADIEYFLYNFRNAGHFDKINGIIIGDLWKCVDKHYPEDTRPIVDIMLEVTKGYNFPIIKVDYFGHELKTFYNFPIGAKANLDTSKKKFEVKL